MTKENLVADNSLSFNVPLNLLTKNQLLRIFMLKNLPLKYPFLYRKHELMDILIRLDKGENYISIISSYNYKTSKSNDCKDPTFALLNTSQQQEF